MNALLYRHCFGSLLIIALSTSVSHSQLHDDSIIKFGHKIAIESKVLKEAREVWVYLPPNYDAKSFQRVGYPVMYILDGNFHFHSISGMIQILGAGVNGTYVIPEMIVVAIRNTDRTRDMTPTHSTTGVYGKHVDYLQSSGGAGNFLRFITEELIPEIESKYRTFPYRILVGHSFGGITAIHALYSMPESFNAYVAIDPSLWWDNKILVQRAKDQLRKTSLKGRSLYVAQANTNNSWDTINLHLQAIKEFAAILHDEKNSDLNWRYKYYPEDSHGSVAFAAEYDALRFFFEKYHANFEAIKTARDLKAFYDEFSLEVGIKFIPPERATLQFAEIYLFLEKYEVAEGFLKMNLENYPESSSAYANMGNLYKRKGDKRKALEFYQQSLAIYPGNSDSKNNVEQLKRELQ